MFGGPTSPVNPASRFPKKASDEVCSRASRSADCINLYYGEVYQGQWKGGNIEGRGTYRYARGTVKVGFYKAEADVGEGVLWMPDGQAAVRLRDGAFVEEISLEEARRVAAEHGLPLPEGK